MSRGGKADTLTDMTGFDPTAPDRDTSKDAPDEFPDNVVPPEVLTEDDGVPAGADDDQRAPSERQ